MNSFLYCLLSEKKRNWIQKTNRIKTIFFNFQENNYQFLYKIYVIDIHLPVFSFFLDFYVVLFIGYFEFYNCHVCISNK